jgi:hypothetical protein
VALVQFVEEGLVRTLRELGLLVHQRHDVQRPDNAIMQMIYFSKVDYNFVSRGFSLSS